MARLRHHGLDGGLCLGKIVRRGGKLCGQGRGHIPGWHDLEESEELHQKEYDELVNIAKNLGMYVQG